MPIDRRRLLQSAAAALASWPIACRTASPQGAGATIPSATDTFLAAVQRGDVSEVRRRLAADPSLARATDEVGRSAFVLAHLARQPEVAEVLQQQGLELDVVEAVFAEDWECVEALAAADPDCMARAHPVGGTPLYGGALVGSPGLYRLRLLRCDPDGRPAGGSGYSPPRGAMECRDALDAWRSTTDLLSNGSDPNVRQRDGDSVLHGAVRRRDERLVRLVLRKDGDVDAVDAAGRTPLDLARELDWDPGVALLRNHEQVARDHRASRFAFDWNREPVTVIDLSDVPLERQSEVTGSSHGQLERVRELVTADPRLVFSISADSELAIEACGHTGNREIIRFHLDHGAPLSLPTAVSLGDVDHARFLLEQDPLLIYERGPHDFALMWYAAIGGDSVELAEVLLEHGTPIDQESLGTTALHWAAMRNRVELTRFLVERGANVDAVSYRTERAGETPLALARRLERDEVAPLLVDAGAREAWR